MQRPSWTEYFMNIAELAKTRSTCLKRQVGSVIVKDKRILTTGYNGAPRGCSHCGDVGCLRKDVPSGTKHEICAAVHAEQNAIVQAAYSGVSIQEATIYTTTQPCSLCAKIIINAGIREVVYKGSYPDELSFKLLREAGVKLKQYEERSNLYDGKIRS
jgi:dCMP deaminase